MTNPTFIIFIDALDESEIPNDSFLSETKQAEVDSPVLNVTPCILGPMLTGEKASHHNLIRPTRLYEDDVVRPANTHIIEEISEEKTVMAHGVPLTGNVSPKNGAIVPSAPRTNINIDIPHLQITRPGASKTMVAKGEEDANSVFNGTVDYIRQFFANARNLARQGRYDTFFLSIRDIDSYTHYHDRQARLRLAHLISGELEEIQLMSDEEVPTFWFSDHGAMEMDDCFRINRWLEEKGYLDIDIHMEEWERSGNDGNVTEQISLFNTHVQLNNETQAFSIDAFDSTIDVWDDSIVEELREELLDTGAFDEVYLKEELFDEEGPKFDEIPRIIPQRRAGLMVSGNIHPKSQIWNGKIDAEGYWRSGVHRRDAAVLGATHDLDVPERMNPVDVYGVLKNFITSQNVPSQDHDDGDDVTAPKDQLEALGYI